LNQSAVYYVQAGNICPGNILQVHADVNTTSSVPVVADQSHCGEGVLTLTASSNDSIFWFDAPGGNLIFIGDTFTTPSLTQSITYYLQAGTECPSTFTSIHASILPISTIPVVVDASRCGPGEVMLNAIAADSVSWYDAPNGNLIDQEIHLRLHP
jgi:hypothetical protein